MITRSILAQHAKRAAEDGGDANSNAGKGQQQDRQNNTDDNLLTDGSLWDDTSNADDGQQQQQARSQQSGNGEQDANEVFQKHIDSLDFTGSVDVAAGMQALQSGDTETFGKMLQQIGANAYRNAMVDANKVIQQRVEKMANHVKTDISHANSTSELVREMNQQLPFTKNKAFAPLANLTLTRFLEKGKSPEEAIRLTGQYFDSLHTEVGKTKQKPPGNRPAGNFGGNFQSNAGNDDDDAPDWQAILSGTS